LALLLFQLLLLFFHKDAQVWRVGLPFLAAGRTGHGEDYQTGPRPPTPSSRCHPPYPPTRYLTEMRGGCIAGGFGVEKINSLLLQGH
jgi:hypothetical protein